MAGRGVDDDDDDEYPEEASTVGVLPTDAQGSSLRIFGLGGPVHHPLPSRGTVVLGRSRSSDVFIDHASISRHHARITVEDELFIEDLGSANGTRVGGRILKPKERVPLAAGEAIDLGSVLVVVQAPVAHPSPPEAAPMGPLSLPPHVIVRDPAMQRLHHLIGRIADSDVNVLVLGETGVGKEIVGEELHRRSSRTTRPYLRLNCAAFSDTLLESELFGHERGAFTGAVSAKEGLLESARGGTVFLDEIGELPLGLQAKLLRVIEDRQVLRVGSVKPKPIDVRFVAATNRDLEEESAAGRFRRDLYFRLDGLSLLVPPLRHRPLDIEPLVARFLAASAEKSGRPVAALSMEALALLTRYAWPGNVRELRNFVERAVLLAGTDTIRPEHFPLDRMQAAAPVAVTVRVPATALKPEIEALERQRIINALAECAGNQTQAARKLGISRVTLLTRLDTYGIARPRKR